eukprot:scaffold38483_cov67-Phaeocystis_antarctica.AAC.4
MPLYPASITYGHMVTGDAAARHRHDARRQLHLPVPQGALHARRAGAAAGRHVARAGGQAAPRGQGGYLRRGRQRRWDLGARDWQASAAAVTSRAGLGRRA